MNVFSPGLLGSASNQLGGGFVTVYPPPSEVQQLRFSDKVTLLWNPESSVGTYNLYRGALTSLSGLGDRERVGPTPSPARPRRIPIRPLRAWASSISVTAKNLLQEEGIKGRASSGALRANLAPCP